MDVYCDFRKTHTHLPETPVKFKLMMGMTVYFMVDKSIIILHREPVPGQTNNNLKYIRIIPESPYYKGIVMGHSDIDTLLRPFRVGHH